MPPTWSARVVDRLIEHRANGTPFERAWLLTLRELPPRAADDGGWSPQLAIHGDLTVTGFLKRACESAWYGTVGAVGSGEGPAIRYFNTGVIRDLDSSAPARRAVGGSRHRTRQAA